MGKKKVQGKAKVVDVENNGKSSESTLRQVIGVALVAVVVAFVISVLTGQDEISEAISDSWNKLVGDPLVMEVIEYVQDLDRLNEVNMDLPSISEDRLEYAMKMNTKNFMDIVNNTEGKMVLVSFFDPRSESYIVTRKDMDKAAKLIKEDPELQSKAAIGMVNVAVDSYLQYVYSPETVSSWQENRNEVKNKGLGFLFGKRNFYPIITKLFKNGEPLREYTDAIRVPQILSFLRLNTAENCTVLDNAAAFDSFVSKQLPAAIGCFPTMFTELNGFPQLDGNEPTAENPAGPFEVESNSFYNLTNHLHGWFFYGYINDESVCKEIDGNFGYGKIMVVNDQGTRHIFGESVEKKTKADLFKYQKKLLRSLRSHRDRLLIEMTPDNSWDLIRTYEHIVILLVDTTDTESFKASEAILEEAAAFEQINAEKNSIKYCYADGRSFASQFGLTKKDLPNLILYHSKYDFHNVFHNGTNEVPYQMMLDASKEVSIQNVVNWIKDAVVGDEKEQNNQQEQQQEPVTQVNDTIEASPIEEQQEVMELRTKPGEGEVDDEDDDEDDEEDVSDSYEDNDEEETSEQKQDEMDEKIKAMAAIKAKLGEEQQQQQTVHQRKWDDIGLLTVESVLQNDHNSIEDLWRNTLEAYEELLLFEESYQNMPKEKKQYDENRALRNQLDYAFTYISNRLHWKMAVETLPKTPADLRRISKDSDTLQDFWVSLQKLATYKQNLLEKVDDISTPGRNETFRSFVEDYVQLYNTVVTIHRTRNTAFLRRFQRENGRKPETGDIQTLEIDRRSATELSLEEFLNEYAKKRKPVIIQDLKMFKEPWTKEYIKEKCGDAHPGYVEKDVTTHNWGGLVSVNERVSLADFLDTHNVNTTRQKWYLHDWSLPRYCPNIFNKAPFDGFFFPKYFAGDYFQRMPFVGYQHSWPSLFVGANKTQSSMHIDSGGTNFWMYLLEGVKEWRFFDRFDYIDLYPEPLSAHFYYDVFDPKPEEQPLIVNAPMYRGIQKPGDLIFIPGGCPHGVRNLDDIVGISMNYLDSSNEWLYLWIQMMDEDFRDYELYANPSFPRGLKKNQQDLTLGEFKSQEWYKMHDELDLF